MDTCGPRTVDHGALLAYGLLRLPTAATCPATAAHTGCAYPRVSRGHADFVDVGFVGIDGTSAAAAHDKRDFVVFLSLSRKTQKNKHQTSNHRSTHILVTCYSTVILLPLCAARQSNSNHCCLPPLLCHLSNSIASHHVHREPRYLICIFTLLIPQKPRTVGE